MKYLDNGTWTKEACNVFGWDYTENMTISGLSKIIATGCFVEERVLYPQFSQQTVKFITLPKDVYDNLMYLINLDMAAVQISRTGYIWFEGYPVVYE